MAKPKMPSPTVEDVHKPQPNLPDLIDPRLLYVAATDATAMANAPPHIRNWFSNWMGFGVAAPHRVDTAIPADFRWLEARWWGIVILTFAVVAWEPGMMGSIAVVGLAPILLYLAMVENE